MRGRKQTFPAGHYFLSFDPEGRWNWAGRVASKIAPGRFEVIVFDAIMLSLGGVISESTRKILTLDDMRGWDFQPDVESFASAVREQHQRMDRDADEARA